MNYVELSLRFSRRRENHEDKGIFSGKSYSSRTSTLIPIVEMIAATDSHSVA